MNVRTSFARRTQNDLSVSEDRQGEIVQFGDREPGNGDRIVPLGRDRRPARRLDPVNGQNLVDREPENQLNYHEDRGVNVNVSSNGMYYRPVREELQLSAYRSVGNFFAWPFRLIGRLSESILNAIMGLFSFILKLLVIPTILFLGISIYQASEGRTAGETAAVVGKESVGVIGGLLSGIWDGLFGDEEAEAPAAEPTENAE